MYQEEEKSTNRQVSFAMTTIELGRENLQMLGPGRRFEIFWQTGSSILPTRKPRANGGTSIRTPFHSRQTLQDCKQAPRDGSLLSVAQRFQRWR